MRLLAAGLLLAALLVLPNASAVASTLSISGPNAVIYFTDSATQSVPLTVNLRLESGFFCQGEGSATVKLTLATSGPITATLDATTLTYAIPSDSPPSTDNPTANHATTAWSAQKPVNLTIVSTGIGNGTATVTGTFDGSSVSGCTATPDPISGDTSGSFASAMNTINVTTQALTAIGNNTTATPTSTTPVSTTPSNETNVTTTPVSSSPVVTTVGENPTPTETKKSPGPEVPLVAAAVVGLAVLARRKK